MYLGRVIGKSAPESGQSRAELTASLRTFVATRVVLGEVAMSSEEETHS